MFASRLKNIRTFFVFCHGLFPSRKVCYPVVLCFLTNWFRASLPVVTFVEKKKNLAVLIDSAVIPVRTTGTALGATLYRTARF